jgi:hypothetical protein
MRALVPCFISPPEWNRELADTSPITSLVMGCRLDLAVFICEVSIST